MSVPALIAVVSKEKGIAKMLNKLKDELKQELTVEMKALRVPLEREIRIKLSRSEVNFLS